MSSRTFHLSVQELKQIEAATNDEHLDVQRRAKALWMVHHGYHFDEIVRTLNIRNRSLIYYWMKRWKQDGIASLFHQAPRSGRPSVADDEYQDVLEAVLSRQPEEYGFVSPGWTVEMLQRVMQNQTGKQLSENTFRTLLHRLGYSFQRVPSQYQLRLPKPKTRKEIGAWREYLMSLPPTSLPVYSWSKKHGTRTRK